MHGSHTHISATNHASREHTVAAILSLLFTVPLSVVPSSALLFYYVSTFRSMCAVPNMAVFCSSLTSWFPGMSLTYCLNYFETVPIAPIITGIIIIIIIIILIIIIIIIIIFVQCIYNCIPETNHVSTVCSVAAACIYNLRYHM